MKTFKEILAEGTYIHPDGSDYAHKVGQHVHHVVPAPRVKAKDGKEYKDTVHHGEITKISKTRFHVKWHHGGESVHHRGTGMESNGGGRRANHNSIPGDGTNKGKFAASGAEYAKHWPTAHHIGAKE